MVIYIIQIIFPNIYVYIDNLGNIVRYLNQFGLLSHFNRNDFEYLNHGDVKP